MNYKRVVRNFFFGTLAVACLAFAAIVALSPEAAAYSQWSVNRDATNCRSCHGDFRATNYVSLVDGQSWGNLHNIHRTNMLNGDCNACHGASTFPVRLGASAGGSGLAGISCMGCHGRSPDAGHDSGSAGLGAGLRQHHTTAGVTVCQGCHSDAASATYKPVGENVKPPYYANPGTNHPNMPTDPCNRGGKENFAGALFGLDNDGDGLTDGADPDCRNRSSMVDFDGDGRTDFAIWRPSTGQWWARRSSDNVASGLAWGSPTDVPVPGDYDGDGMTDQGIWRSSTGQWWVHRSSDNAAAVFAFGAPTDRPVPGDYDGDGKSDFAVWRPSTGQWWVQRSSDNTASGFAWGSPTDEPVPGDYDGDGKTDYAVWRPATGTWLVSRSSDNVVATFAFGSPSDVPVPGDYDGDGKTDYAVWRPATGMWLVSRSSDNVVATFAFGSPSDVPVPGDYDGDGKTDFAVWRPATGEWIVRRTSDTAVTTFPWGSPSDVALGGR